MKLPNIRGIDAATLPANYPEPSHFDIEQIIRPNILSLEPYRCARDDYDQGILLDANENALGPTIDSDQSQELHRYPSPSHPQIKQSLVNLRKLPSIHYAFLGVGSDEVIDLLYRITCTPTKDMVITCPPTYGMYGVCAVINDVQVKKVPLDVNHGRFQLDLPAIKKAYADDTENKIKMTFVCSPGNPTGTLIKLSDIKELLEDPNNIGLVVVDEAYIDFTDEEASAVSLIEKYSNLVVMQTLSKSFGLAGIRLGVALAQPPLIQVLSNTKAPYNVSTPSARLAEEALSDNGIAKMKEFVAELKKNRDYLIEELSKLPNVGVVRGANDANFVLLPILDKDAKEDNNRAIEIYKYLAETEKVVVRYRGSELGCAGCLRISIGTKTECIELINKLKQLL
ncbi:histidinol-phosphate aminotransferase [Wallemia mellicola CBS 633.66]|uniref:histidinol-phosphate transaminase n=1 Tax=Wallemia mellicola (strain ATCC MYA-4683 / CBS 633.66) TaxID=671144 RepID=I4YH44_WALMC|nr:histidinol-phosphate aminotransferase [Wallemia mellicola CBS 633.66]EIM23286.1 histidinol-phosphate aminotransferase [Wallemia mellicola CBS 633.66]|eukprot:XP_006956674.1 histidinol-phosphate aminotransferase [Wallemia mellicola CBS 633.66]